MAKQSVAKQSVAESQLVVIGSSAGGIEALTRVVSSLPSDFPAPIVIAQHLDTRRPSHLGEILSRHATLPIKVVEDAVALEDGVIFVIPSNKLVEIVDGELRLRPAKAGSVAPSVDLLLETAAVAFGPGLTAVIQTGTGSDGSAGAWHVKKAGGAVVIENPATASAAARQAASDALRVPTPRELEILDLVAEGLSNADIAERLSLRIKTVESQLRRLFDRYDVTSRTALVRLAARQGWSEEDQ